MPSATDKYRLGKACTFSVNGQILGGVRDVSVRRIASEVDATGYGHSAKSTAVIHRTYEIDVIVLKPSDVDKLRAVEAENGVITVTTTNGLREVSADFMVCESTADEPLDDAVIATFVLKEWKHGK